MRNGVPLSSTRRKAISRIYFGVAIDTPNLVARSRRNLQHSSLTKPHLRPLQNTGATGQAAIPAYRRTASKAVIRSERRGATKAAILSPAKFASRDNRMHSHIQFITTPTSETPGTALWLQFEDSRYFFGNTHEGLQRAGLQFGAKLWKARDFFLTGQTSWQTNGGLLGMILTLADATKARTASLREAARLKLERAIARKEEQQRQRKTGKNGKLSTPQTTPVPVEKQTKEEEPVLNIHGGPNITHTLATARAFVFRQGLAMDVDEFLEGTERTGPEQDWQPTWTDDRIQVWAMPIASLNKGGSHTTQRPVSPRKRSLGEYMEGQSPSTTHATDPRENCGRSPESIGDSSQQIREYAVREMFRSNWRFDNLVETPLHEVKLPATLFVRDPETKKIIKYSGPMPDSTAAVPNVTVLVRQPWPGALIDQLPPTKRSTIAMSYIVRNHRQRGRFRPDVAKALNVPPGPLWNALARGAVVLSTDGKTVTPDMVLEAGKEGGGVAVIELPSKDYIWALIHRPEWHVDRIMVGVGAFIWLLGPGVAQDETLLKFMDDFKHLNHIVSSPDQCPNSLSMMSAAAAALRHHQIDPERYGILQHSNVEFEHPLNFIPARRGLKVQLEPSIEIQDGAVIEPVNTAEVIQQMPKAVLKLAKEARDSIAAEHFQNEILRQNLSSPESEIVCLGTGSALPSLHRNVSGTLLRVPGCGSYLFDCGENTLGQLNRIYSPAQLSEVLRDLKMIWISHLHADHHLGTASVIKAWYEEVHGKDYVKRPKPSVAEQFQNPVKLLDEGKRLFVVGHSHMLRWLEEYSSVEDFGYDQLVPLEPSSVNINAPEFGKLEWNGVDVGFNTSRDAKIKSAIRNATCLENLVTCSVAHCFGAKAVSMTFRNGFKFSYSGDCRPSKAFTVIGKGSTVLVHEATFDDEMQGDAVAKRHSTISEAIGVGAAMGARRVILTHFSQRYSKIPTMDNLDNRAFELRDTEDTEDAVEGADMPVDAPQPIDSLLDTLDQDARTGQAHVNQRNGGDHLTKPDVSGGSASIPEALRNNDMKVAVAFDYMRVKVKDIASLEKFTPALRLLYKEDEEMSLEEKRKSALSDSPSGGGKNQNPKDKNSPSSGPPVGQPTPLVEQAKPHQLSIEKDSMKDIGDKLFTPQKGNSSQDQSEAAEATLRRGTPLIRKVARNNVGR